MAGRPSVLRPPTPDTEEDSEEEALPEFVRPRPRQLSVKELVEVKLEKNGRKDELKELLRRRLIDCGWRDKLKVDCRAYVKKVGRDNLSTNDVLRYITPKGRASVPGPVKAELLQAIQSLLQP